MKTEMKYPSVARSCLHSPSEAFQTRSQRENCGSRRSNRVKEQRGWDIPQPWKRLLWPDRGRGGAHQLVESPQKRAGKCRPQPAGEHRSAAPITADAELRQQLVVGLLFASEGKGERRHKSLFQSLDAFG